MPIGSPQAVMFGASSLLGLGDDDLPLIASTTFSGATAPQIIGLDFSLYHTALVVVSGLTVNTDGTQVLFRVSVDNGSTWNDGNDYEYVTNFYDTNAGDAIVNDLTATSVNLSSDGAANGIGSAAGENFSSFITLHDPAGSLHKNFSYSSVYNEANGRTVHWDGAARRKVTADIDAISLIDDGVVQFTGAMYVHGMLKA